MKDPDYFNSVVKPFLLNKMEKTFIDYWLLDLHDAMNTFTSISKIQDLNTLEQCLMVQFLMKTGQKELAT